MKTNGLTNFSPVTITPYIIILFKERILSSLLYFFQPHRYFSTGYPLYLFLALLKQICLFVFSHHTPTDSSHAA